MKRKGEATSIFASHGIGDAATTTVAAAVVGAEHEANPIIRHLLVEQGQLVTALVMVAVVAVAAALWSTAAEIARSPPQVGYAVAAVGAFVCIHNVAVVVAAVTMTV